MEKNNPKENAETRSQHLRQLILEMDDLIANLHNLQLTITEIRKESGTSS